MTGIGTEYAVAAKPLYWGGGRYVQNRSLTAREDDKLHGMCKKLNKS